MRPVLLPLGALLLLVSGCAGGSAQHSASPQSDPTVAPTRTADVCPTFTRPAFRWPTEVPADLPQPPAATYKSVYRANGVTTVRFSAQISLREGLLFVLRSLPKAGFAVGRGDAEPAEADVPFGRDNLNGIFKEIVLGPCSTDWLVAVTVTKQGGGSPILPTPSQGPSSTPFPLG